MPDIVRPRRFQGVVLLVAPVIVNPWVVGRVLTDDGAIDDRMLFAGLLFLAVAGVLGGLQVLVRWVDALAWKRPVGFTGAAVTVLAAAAIISGAHWRITSYNAGHQHEHTIQVDTGHDHTTPEQRQWAEDFYRRSLASAIKHGWFDHDRALMQGFQVDPINGSHFPNQQNLFDDRILDPDHPEWLIFNDSPDGKVLTGFMFFTRSLDEVGPTPGGTLAQWHYHPYGIPRCAINGLWTVAKTDDQGRCAEGKGIPVSKTPQMLHVWFVDHPLGRFTEMNFIPMRIPNEWLDGSTLHPIVVHFGIALFVVAILLDAFAMVTRRASWHHAAWLNLAVAAVGLVAAVAAGMESEIALNPTHEVHAVLDVHKTLAYSSLGLVIVLAVWRYALRGGFPKRSAAVLYSVVSLAGLLTISGAGYYGGALVYEHGAGVRAIDRFARERYFDQVREVYRTDPGLIRMDGVRETPPPPAEFHSGDHSGHH